MKTIILSDRFYSGLDNAFRQAEKEFRPQFHQADWISFQLKQMEKTGNLSRAHMADKFIDLANEFTKTESKDRVGAAFMFAAARYNAFEAFAKSSDISRDKDDAINWYTREYKRMLEANMDDLIQLNG